MDLKKKDPVIIRFKGIKIKSSWSNQMEISASRVSLKGTNLRVRNLLTTPDFLGLNTCLYEWADSYDSKDWERLSKCIAPTLRVCLPSFQHSKSLTNIDL